MSQTITLYRDNSRRSVGVKFQVYVDGELAATLGRGESVSVKVQEGIHRLQAVVAKRDGSEVSPPRYSPLTETDVRNDGRNLNLEVMLGPGYSFPKGTGWEKEDYLLIVDNEVARGSRDQGGVSWQARAAASASLLSIVSILAGLLVFRNGAGLVACALLAVVFAVIAAISRWRLSRVDKL